MKSKFNFIPAAIALSLFSSAAIAGTSVSEQDSNRIASGTSQSLMLEKMIQKNTEQKFAAETNKYSQISTLAGDRQNELAKRKLEVATAYKAWQDSKFAVEQSRNPDSDSFRAVNMAAEAYSQANRSFIELQKDILARNGASADLIVAFNAAPPTAAGSK